MSLPVSIGLIGCGAIGEEHTRCLASLEGASLRAFCDLDEQRAAGLSHTYNGIYHTTKPERLFTDEAIDAVYICTNTDSHAALAVAAAQAGKHVMMEKPLALTEGECFEIAEAVERAGVTFMTAFKFRFYPAVRRTREFVPSPTIAIGQMMDARWPDDFWGNDPVKGGGNVLSQGCHSVDLLYHLVGSEPIRVFAEGGNFQHQEQRITDTLVATLQFANGAVGTLVQADSGHTPFLSKLSFQVFDGERSAHLHNRLKSVMLWDGEQAISHEDSEEVGMLEESRAFVKAVRELSEPPTGVKDGVRATVVLLRAIESMITNRPQAIHV
jgi:predicted dehydrogenase